MDEILLQLLSETKTHEVFACSVDRSAHLTDGVKVR